MSVAAGIFDNREAKRFDTVLLSADSGQESKGTRGMPRRREAMKGVISCEKLRRAANKPRPGGTRMGEPDWGNTQ
jgi:hypothetical protein